MTTQTDAINWLQAQIGQHLDYDQQYGQQCVDFYNYYYQYLTGENPYSVGYAVPSAYMIWGVDNGNFTKIPDSADLLPQPGDIAIYGIAWGAGNGHVEVVLATDSSGCTFIGENEHNNASEGVVQVHRTFAQMRGLIGVMRPNWQASQPLVQTAKYTVTETYDTGKQIQLNKQPTYLWGMNFDFDYMKDHPIEEHNQGEIWTVTNKVHHIDGYDYYRRDGQVDGFNVADCDDYTPPYIPPTGASNAKPVEKYPVVTTLKTYASADNAMSGANPVSTLDAGEYIVFSKGGASNKAYNLTSDNMKDMQQWVNTLDNIAPVAIPKPETIILPSKPVKPIALKPSQVRASGANDTKWRATYKSFHPDNSSDTFTLVQDVKMLDYSGQRQYVVLRGGTKINSPGTFQKDGVTFYRIRANNDVAFSWWYGISMKDDDGNAMLLKHTNMIEEQEIKLGHLIHWWKDDFLQWWDVRVLKRKKK